MARDVRELIITRLEEIARTIPLAQYVFRNRIEVSDSQRPAIVVIDGDEEGATGDFALGRPALAPNIMHLTPEIVAMVSLPYDAVGPALNAMRVAVLKAVLNDAPLGLLVGSTGGVQYQGCSVSLAPGRTTEGEMAMKFAVHYRLIPNEL